MSEKFNIEEAIKNTFDPFEFLITYLIWKHKGMSAEDLDEEIRKFIEAIIPLLIKDMIKELIKSGYLKENEDKSISLGDVE